MDKELICPICRLVFMKKEALVAIMLISCIMAGCTDADLEEAEQALGCTYSDALNYNVTAAIDDGSCIYPEPTIPILGCMYQQALNYNPSATEDDGSCRYPVVEEPVPGCTYSDAYNYDMNATEDDGTCVYDRDGDGIIDDFEELGCTDVNANNYNSSSTDNDGSCDYDQDDDGVYDWAESGGCVDTNATNYDAGATESNQTMCDYPYILTLADLESYLENQGGLESIVDGLGEVTSFIRLIEVTESAEEEGMESDSNANTTAAEIIMGHDPINEIVYQSMIMRIVGDISIEQTTVQGPDGINYRIGSPDSGSWYYARDEVYHYENPFPADEDSEGDQGGGTSEDDEGESLCDEFTEGTNSFNWADNWTITTDNGINMAEGRNAAHGLDAKLEFIGNPPLLTHFEVSQFSGMARCSIEILDPSLFEMAIDTELPRTSMSMKMENQIEEDSGSSKTWSAELSDEHFEEVSLNEIVMRVYAGEGDSEEGGSGGSLVTEMLLNEQTSTFTDQCYQWSLSWSDNDNDGYTSAGDSYSISRTEKVIDPCDEDDEYRSKDFQIVFYDLWADMPTGGVFTPGFGLVAAISAILFSSMFIGMRPE